MTIAFEAYHELPSTQASPKTRTCSDLAATKSLHHITSNYLTEKHRHKLHLSSAFMSKDRFIQTNTHNN